MKAVSVELVPREFSSVVFGVICEMSVMSSAPWFSSRSAEKALIAIGTSCRFSVRRRAVTTITLPSSAVFASFSCASCAIAAGASAVRAAAATPSVSAVRVAAKRVNPKTDMNFLPAS